VPVMPKVWSGLACWWAREMIADGTSIMAAGSLCWSAGRSCRDVRFDRVGNQFSRLFEVVHYDDSGAPWWGFGEIVVKPWVYFL
jgi:hypothetical protein